jgi:hypothetical protein
MEVHRNGEILLVRVITLTILLIAFLELNFHLEKKEIQSLFIHKLFIFCIRLYYIKSSSYTITPTDNLLPYAYLNDIYINTNTDELSFNEDKLYCGCSDFPGLSVDYGYGRIDDDVILNYLFVFISL